MKILIYFLLLFIAAQLLTIYSCNKDKNDFGVDDTFTADTLAISPASNIDTEFSIGWGVTTTGFPTYFVDMFLSNDTIPDAGDLKISSTASVDTETGLNTLDDAQFYQVKPVTGTNKVVFLHNEKTNDPNATGWNTSDQITDPSGSSKFIVAYFYNTQGVQIKYGRRQIAVAVSFK